jgi:hypothetical protein
VIPFESHGVKQTLPLTALVIIFQMAKNLGSEPEIVIFPSEMPSPWICFNVGDRRFGIWVSTMKLYEADEHGAMGEDEVKI